MEFITPQVGLLLMVKYVHSYLYKSDFRPVLSRVYVVYWKKSFLCRKKTIGKEFHDSPGKFHCQRVGSIPGGGTEIPQATWCAQKKKKKNSILCCTWSLSRVQLFATPWTIAHQALLSMGIL